MADTYIYSHYPFMYWHYTAIYIPTSIIFGYLFLKSSQPAYDDLHVHDVVHNGRLHPCYGLAPDWCTPHCSELHCSY